jgi:hypothetical protein
MMMRWFAGRFNKREHGSWALGLLTVFPSSERAARTEQAGWLQREREREAFRCDQSKLVCSMLLLLGNKK